MATVTAAQADELTDVMSRMDIEDAANFVIEAVRYARGEYVNPESPVFKWEPILRDEGLNKRQMQESMLCAATRIARHNILGTRVVPTLLFTAELAERFKNHFEAAYDLGGQLASHVLWRYSGTEPEHLSVSHLPSDIGEPLTALEVFCEKGYLVKPDIDALAAAISGDNGHGFVAFWRYFLDGEEDAGTGEKIVCKAMRRLRWVLRTMWEMESVLAAETLQRIRQLVDDAIECVRTEQSKAEVTWRLDGSAPNYPCDPNEQDEPPISDLLRLLGELTE